MSQPLSLEVIPDTDFFSTPPSTPVAVGQPMHIPESWRNNSTRPSLQIDPGRSDWNPDIKLSTTTSPLTKKTNGIQMAPLMTQDPTIVQVPPSVTLPSDPQNHKPDNSPCFVHSHLDKGTLLSDWLRNKHHVVECGDVGVAKSLQRLASPAQSDFKSGHDSNDENEFFGSLTKQLADTAVGVREISKQLGAFLPLFQLYSYDILGRARVQSNIQNILIVTKARDNRLIKLTRELALYLMLKQRHGSQRGLVVYVHYCEDSQIISSSLFSDMWINNCVIPNDLMLKASNTIIQNSLSHFPSVGPPALIPCLLCHLLLLIETTAMKDN